MSDPQKDQVLGHDYDGIQEYDNRLPNWWLWLLYGSIVFAIGYWLWFQTYSIGRLPLELYEAEVAAAAEAALERMAGQEVTDETIILISQIPASIEAAKGLWDTHCSECHVQGEGKIGPNLTDNYWIHGSKPLDILKTITDGVPDKGMVAWGEQLPPGKIQKLAAYVLTLKGKNLPGRAPEGDLVEPEG